MSPFGRLIAFFLFLVAILGFMFNTAYQQKEILVARVAQAMAKQNALLHQKASAESSPDDKSHRDYRRQPRNFEKEAWLLRKLDTYVEFHKNVTSGVLPPRYLACQLMNGYGNCWQLFVSCVLFAMMSDRAFFVETWVSDNPFVMTMQEFYLPPPVRIYQENINNRTPLYGPQNGKTWPELTSIEQVSMCRNLLDWRPEDPYLLVNGPSGFDYYADHIRDNPHHELLHKLPYNFYSIIFNYWWKLRPQYQAEVNRFKREHFGKWTIGMQIRGWDHGGVIPVIPLNVFLQAADVLAADAPVPPEDVVFFAVTQDKEQVERFQSIFGTQKLIFYAGNASAGTDPAMNKNAYGLMHMWLMGEVDELITTEQSSYGCNAAARTGLVPVVCNHLRVCVRRLSAQPCSYNPFPTYRMLEDVPGARTTLNNVTCYRNASATFKRHSSVESHCGFFFRHVYDCVRHGCENPHDSFRRPLPHWPPQPCCNPASPA
eukprot:TRINITY_DN5771_c0_g1_i2.p1 TRINITY_DN5771_c0_g1~~TRINITY_DN5771_c0_g1_i2.p1  ORF type:complete len:486 (-),score=149.99 TRINITY_DN5771_c0_g1_i2:443-1900(-)